MKRKRVQSIEWLEFEILQEFPEVRHAIFLRNQNFSLIDSDENRNHILKLMHLEKGVRLEQCHDKRLIEITHATLGWSMHENFDGMITKEKNIGLLIVHADCQAAIFYDPVTKSIANVHSGWRGSVKNIYRETITQMRKRYKSNPKDIRVCISPSLGPEMAEFKHYKEELPKHFWVYQTKPTYFDFWEISRMQLREEGILDKHLEIAGICTYLNPDLCFSYRREKPTGHHGTLVSLN